MTSVADGIDDRQRDRQVHGSSRYALGTSTALAFRDMKPSVVGRDRALAAGKAFLARLRAGPEPIRVEGDPGIGKTAVWRATADVAALALRAELPVFARVTSGSLLCANVGTGSFWVGLADRRDALAAAPAAGLKNVEVVTRFTSGPRERMKTVDLDHDTGPVAAVTKVGQTPDRIADPSRVDKHVKIDDRFGGQAGS